MKYRNLGNSGLKVPEIGLGGGSFGFRVTDEHSVISIIDQALDMGINYIDTSEYYGETRSEEWIGRAIKGKRSKVIIATKFGVTHASRFGLAADPNEGGGSRYWIMKAVEGSLRRLNTDYIDLYQMHQPDLKTPIEETLQTLNTLVQAGKVRYIGCSNFAGWQLSEALWTSKVHSLESFVSIQSEYSLLERGIEQEIVPCCQAHGVGVIPYRALAAGFLTGRYRRGESVPVVTRFGIPETSINRFLNDANFTMLEKLQAFATAHGHTVGELTIAWLLSHPWLSTVLVGTTRPEQLAPHLTALEWKLSTEEIAEVDSISSS